mmetsp:Transcript_7357/g.13382  ORF Transcript_7357/g.13382 Transcript_7357/m.13382 type:complete len:303 (-) Transcript_7357:1486-2394(-)
MPNVLQPRNLAHGRIRNVRVRQVQRRQVRHHAVIHEVRHAPIGHDARVQIELLQLRQTSQMGQMRVPHSRVAQLQRFEGVDFALPRGAEYAGAVTHVQRRQVYQFPERFAQCGAADAYASVQVELLEGLELGEVLQSFVGDGTACQSERDQGFGSIRLFCQDFEAVVRDETAPSYREFVEEFEVVEIDESLIGDQIALRQIQLPQLSQMAYRFQTPIGQTPTPSQIQTRQTPTQVSHVHHRLIRQPPAIRQTQRVQHRRPRECQQSPSGNTVTIVEPDHLQGMQRRVRELEKSPVRETLRAA